MHIVKRYGWIVGLALFVFLIYSQSDDQKAVVQTASGPDDTEVMEGTNAHLQKDSKVDVKGEVNKPGVYTIQPGMRVDDVISLAGGLTSQADPESVNLAQVLEDEMVVLVLPEGEEDAKGVHSSDQLRINQASVEEIQTLSGIGPSKAQALIDYREENGPFTSVEELMDVSGIGEKTLEGIQDEIRIP